MKKLIGMVLRFWLKLIAIVFIFIAVIVAFMIFLPNESYYYNYEEMKNNVIKIEIVDMFQNTSNVHNNIILLKALDDDEADRFLSELSETEFIIRSGTPHEMGGTSIMIYYNNGDIKIISRLLSSLYNADGKNIGGDNKICKEDDWNTLLSKFVNDT